MTEIEKIVHDALQKKMSDGSFEKILDEYVTKAINNLLMDMFDHSTWREDKDGEAYKFVKATLSPFTMQALADCNLTECAKKTKIALDEIIRTSVAATTTQALTTAVTMFDSQSKIDYLSEYKLTDIFKAYCNMVKDVVDKDWLDEHNVDMSDGCAELSASCCIDPIESKCYDRMSKAILVTFRIGEEDDKDDNSTFTTQFILRQDYKQRWVVDVGNARLGFDELANMDSLNLLLRTLDRQSAIITDMNECDQTITIEGIEEDE